MKFLSGDQVTLNYSTISLYYMMFYCLALNLNFVSSEIDTMKMHKLWPVSAKVVRR